MDGATSPTPRPASRWLAPSSSSSSSRPSDEAGPRASRLGRVARSPIRRIRRPARSSLDVPRAETPAFHAHRPDPGSGNSRFSGSGVLTSAFSRVVCPLSLMKTINGRPKRSAGVTPREGKLLRPVVSALSGSLTIRSIASRASVRLSKEGRDGRMNEPLREAGAVCGPSKTFASWLGRGRSGTVAPTGSGGVKWRSLLRRDGRPGATSQISSTLRSEASGRQKARNVLTLSKGLILAQNERWRRGLGMQVVRAARPVAQG